MIILTKCFKIFCKKVITVQQCNSATVLLKMIQLETVAAEVRQNKKIFYFSPIRQKSLKTTGSDSNRWPLDLRRLNRHKDFFLLLWFVKIEIDCRTVFVDVDDDDDDDVNDCDDADVDDADVDDYVDVAIRMMLETDKKKQLLLLRFSFQRQLWI